MLIRPKVSKSCLRKNVVETEAPRINKYDEFIQNLKEEIHEINEKIVENEKINVNNVSNVNMNISSGDIDRSNSNNISYIIR